MKVVSFVTPTTTPFLEISKDAGIKRFVYASSSSVYGLKDEKDTNENASLKPLTDYSKYKAMCEEILLKYGDDNFVPTIIRPATVCGYSKRQRFDLVVNLLTNFGFNNKLITVFGCGGDRDAGKRPIMGAIAETHSDLCVVTSDNPRSENPQKIITDITKGMSQEHPTFVQREEAIAYAIHHADIHNDVVLIAGKGHETYQEILGVKHPFDDRMMATKYAPKGEIHAI